VKQSTCSLNAKYNLCKIDIDVFVRAEESCAVSYVIWTRI